MGRVSSPPPQVPKCGDLDRRFQAVDSAPTPKSGGSLEPEERRPPLGNFVMTLKTHLLLALIVWVGFAPYAWAEEKTAAQETPPKELRAKAEKGDAGSQYNLGLAYAKGRGIPKDQAEAAKWFRKAAEQGHADAQFSLALRYALGDGVPKDDVLAYKWFLLAGAKHEKHRKAISIIEHSLTPEQRAEGQKLAREFKPVVQK